MKFGLLVSMLRLIQFFYRSECENCKFAGIAEGEEEIPETMTLQRRPLELEEEMSYYRTSLTLPTHSKKPRYFNTSLLLNRLFTFSTPHKLCVSICTRSESIFYINQLNLNCFKTFT